MWKLVSKKSGNPLYMLAEKQKYTVGRLNCNFNLINDPSISRNHANLLPSIDYVEVIDVGSKYETYCNENIDNKVPLKVNESFKLNNGERVRFGLYENEFTLVKVNIVTVVSTSTLDLHERENLQQIMNIISGRIQDKVTPECTHLTMNTITITSKLLVALFEGIPIVTIKFWNDFLKSVRNGNKLPEPTDYLPERNVGDSFFNIEKEMLNFKEERKVLFNDKIFIFLNKKNYDIYFSIIQRAGGRSTTLNKQTKISNLAKRNVIVVQYTFPDSQQSSQSIDKISEFLKTKSLRLIPDYEIGLALVHCSLKRYCNTQFNFENELQNDNVNSMKEFTEKLNIIAEETPIVDSNKNGNALTELEVPETIVSAVYDLTESDVEETNAVDLENESQNHFDDCDLSMIFEKENIPSKNQNKIENKEKKEIQNKRKRDVSPCNEKQNKKINFEENFIEKTVPTTCNKPLSGFLDTSLIRKEKLKNTTTFPLEISNLSESTTNTQTKRRRFAVIDSDSENEDNLFDFGKKNKKKQRIISSSDEADSINNDENSSFQLKTRDTRSNNSKSIESNSNVKQKSSEISSTNIQSNFSKNSTKDSYTKWKPKIIDEPISTVGWLSKKMIKVKIESGLNISDDKTKNELNTSDKDNINTELVTNTTIKTEDNTKWINSLKDVFEVRVKPMQLVSKVSSFNICESTSGNSLNKTNGKNFKAFVKKRNFKPQKEILTTVPYHVTGFSF